jgi:hypothetical protein
MASDGVTVCGRCRHEARGRFDRSWQGSFPLCAAPIARKRLVSAVRGQSPNLGRCIHLPR